MIYYGGHLDTVKVKSVRPTQFTLKRRLPVLTLE